MNKIIEWVVGQYGFLGVALVILAAVIVYVVKDSKKEREQARKEHLDERQILQENAEKHFETLVEITQQSTSALKGIETLIQSIDRRIKP